MILRHDPTLHECLAALRHRESELRAHGLIHADIFGSVARGDSTEESDVDILATLDYSKGVTSSTLMDAEQLLSADLGRSVDVVSRGGLKSPKHDRILAEAVRAF